MSLFWWTSRIAVDGIQGIVDRKERAFQEMGRQVTLELDEDNVIISSALFIGKAVKCFRLETVLHLDRNRISYNCIPHPPSPTIFIRRFPQQRS